MHPSLLLLRNATIVLASSSFSVTDVIKGMEGTSELTPLLIPSSSATSSSAQAVPPPLNTVTTREQFLSFIPTTHGSVELGAVIRESLLGQVLKGKYHCQDAFAVAVKVFDISHAVSKISKSGQRLHEDAFTEIEVHKYVTQKNIRNVIQLYSLGCRSDHQLHLCMEFAAKGDLFSFVLANHGRLPLATAGNFFVQLMSGVRDLHAINVVHRDLSLENLLLTEAHEIKICDFGLATMCDPKVVITDGIARGKVKYMAPELYCGETYDPRLTDIWAAGVILFIVLNGIYPYAVPSADEPRLVALCNGQLSDLLASWKLPALDAKTLDLFSHIFCAPARRWDAQQILSHPFCAQFLHTDSDKSTKNPKSP